jgi:hypothetical protein
MGSQGIKHDLYGPREGQNIQGGWTMKLMKWLVPLAIVIVLLAIALPAAAQGPTVQVVTYKGPVVVVSAGTNVDPFGGFPKSSRKFSDTGILPGGTPSDASGNGVSPRAAINISGAWAAGKVPTEAEIPTCTTLTIPAGVSRWFKAATWKDRQLIVWLDDELDGATRPSGSAIFGGASGYMAGTASGGKWQSNAYFDSPNSQTGYARATGPSRDGYVMAIYDPDALQPNGEFAPPNAFILTVNTSGSGGLLRSKGNVSVGSVGGGPHGFGQFNFGEPQHLMWYDGHFDGWVYIRVINQMVWNGTATVCSYRHVPGVR